MSKGDEESKQRTDWVSLVHLADAESRLKRLLGRDRKTVAVLGLIAITLPATLPGFEE